LSIPHPPTPTSFPYTTLFRSLGPLSGAFDPRTLVTYDATGVRVMDQTSAADFAQVTGTGAFVPNVNNHLATSTPAAVNGTVRIKDRKSTRLNSSHDQISYAVF